MNKLPEHSNQVDLIDLLQGVDDEPERFDILMESWNSLFEQSDQQQERVFSDIENAARSSVASMSEVAPQTPIGRQVGQLLERFSSPAFLVRETGQILAQNSAALHIYGTANASTLDDLPFALEMDVPVADVVRSSLDPCRNLHDAILKRGYSDVDDAPITLSIAPSKPMVDGVGEALVFVVDARWKTEAAGLIKREFDLTEAERELLVAFLDGQTTQDMAASRNRSHATVKTQFKSLMSKMGARSQTELFRNALSVSQFVDKVGEIAEVLRHPHRKRVDILRPGGRSVEVTLAGDLSGKPLVFIQNCVAYTFESHIEQAFHDAGFCVLSICRPGYGDTDPALKEHDLLETTSHDIEAVLDQLGHDKCILLASNMSSAIMFALSKFLQNRLLGLAQVAGGGPLPYFESLDQSVPWAKGLMRASKKHPILKALMIRTGLKAWCTMGQIPFLRSQLGDDEAELRRLSEPPAIRELELALNVATKQGHGAAAYDLSMAISDFRIEVVATNLPILIAHGTLDPVFAMAGMREFAKDFDSRITLIELPDAGFSALATHTSVVVKHLAAFYDTHS